MRRLLSITIAATLAFSVSPALAAAAERTDATTDATARADDEAACRKELGYTDEQLKIGTFIEFLRDCVGTKTATRRGAALAAKLQKQRKEMAAKGAERFRGRLRGKDPSTLAPIRAAPQVTASRKVKNRISARSRRAKVWERDNPPQAPEEVK